MNLSYPVISSPLYQERPGIKIIKKEKITSKNNYKKTIANNRKNTGIVNNMDQHITAGIVAFINWLADTVKEIQEADVYTTCMQKDNKEKISPRRAKRMAARKNAKKCKQVLQTHGVEALADAKPTKQSATFERKKRRNLERLAYKIEKKEYKKANDYAFEGLKTLIWVNDKRCQNNAMEKLLLELKREEMLQEAKKEKEAQDIAQWVISVRKLQNMTDYLQYTLPEDIQDEEEFIEYDENQTDYNEVYEKARGNIRAAINTFNCKSK